MFKRDTLSKLVALSHKHRIGVDLDSVLVYPLAPVCLPLSTADGAIRKTIKSKLFTTAMSDLTVIFRGSSTPRRDTDLSSGSCCRHYRTIVGQVATIRDLASNIMTSIPKPYQTIYMVCDTYRINCIKGGERQQGGV